MDRRTTHKTAFTLIELLVVVAIISLLVSILIPSLQKAKELAKISVCAAKLRSLGQAGHMYFSENNGDIPYGFTIEPINIALNPYIPWAKSPAEWWIPSEHWVCPNSPNTSHPSFGLSLGFDFGTVKDGVWFGAWGLGRENISTIKSMSDRIWMTECGWVHNENYWENDASDAGEAGWAKWDFSGTIPGCFRMYALGPMYGPNPVYPYLALRHFLKSTTVFLDGHTETLGYDDLNYPHLWVRDGD